MSNLCPLSIENSLHDRIMLSLGNAVVCAIPIIAINAYVTKYFQTSPNSSLLVTTTTLLMRSILPIVDHQISRAEYKAHSYIHSLARTAFYLSINIFLSNQFFLYGTEISILEVVGYTFSTSILEKGCNLVF